MEDLTKPFFRPRKQSLSAIIERIVLEKQRQKEKAIFEQQPPAQTPVTVTKVEPLELIDDSANDSRSGQSQGDFPALGLNFSQDGDSSMPDMSQLAPRAPHHSSVIIHHSSASFVSQEDDEEMDDDDSTEKEDANIDPERLKAFNLFVRLNVDEHLDRTVPISKQPKERIQTIIDSCSRQFPEFEDRARKRLRTYLKACRRHKKLREPLTVSEVGSLGRLSRAASGQLGSAQAEAILAQACHNETRGSKRRLSTTDDAETTAANQDGQQTPLMQVSSMIPPESSSAEAPSVSCVPAPAPVPAPVSSLASYLSMASHLAPIPASTHAPTPMPVPAPGPTPVTAERAFYPDPSMASVLNHQLNLQPPTSAFYHVDVNQLLRHVLPNRAGGPPPPPPHGAGGDLYFRRSSQNPLSFSEAVAVRALADGYRQSASLLRRTADELESLIPHSMP